MWALTLGKYLFPNIPKQPNRKQVCTQTLFKPLWPPLHHLHLGCLKKQIESCTHDSRGLEFLPPSMTGNVSHSELHVQARPPSAQTVNSVPPSISPRIWGLTSENLTIRNRPENGGGEGSIIWDKELISRAIREINIMVATLWETVDVNQLCFRR